MANGRRPVSTARKLVAAMLGTLATFIILFGAGMTSWAIAALGVALLVLAISLVLITAFPGTERAWVAGIAHVRSVSEPPASSTYGRCELQILVDAPGVPPRSVKVRDPRVPVAKWPDPGATLPIMVAFDDQRHVRIMWDDVLTHAEAAAERADLPSEFDEPDFEPLDDDLLISDDDLLGEEPPWVRRDDDDLLPDPDTVRTADLSEELGALRDPAAAPMKDDAATARRGAAENPRPDFTRNTFADDAFTEPMPDASTAAMPDPQRVSDRGQPSGDEQQAAEPERVPEPPESDARPVEPDLPGPRPEPGDRPRPGPTSRAAAGPQPEERPEPVVVSQTPGGQVVLEGTLVDPPPVPLPRRPRPQPTTPEPEPAGESTATAAATGTALADPPGDGSAGGRTDRPGAGQQTDQPVGDQPAGHLDADDVDAGDIDPGPIHGVGLTLLVADLARSVEFYRDMLGFFEIDGGDGNAVLASGSTRLVLRSVPEVAPVNRRLMHLNLEVDDLQRVHDELKSKGVRFTYAPRAVNRGARTELWAAAFRDPDGHGIAIIQWRDREQPAPAPA
ncbi:VOC family protein [Solwaraspora sp. WMMB335]|uniref:VOC family protein n=1 Tax=Solwaraspora sp. WMMB335 TaxID=3404118 RepID=UPI003B92D2E1